MRVDLIPSYPKFHQRFLETITDTPTARPILKEKRKLHASYSDEPQICRHATPRFRETMIVQLFLAACLLPSVHSEGVSVSYCYHLPSCNQTTWATNIPEHCNGTRQSPINIVTAAVKENANLTSFIFRGFNDSSALWSIENADGKTVKVTIDDNKVNVSGGDLPDLYKTLHFHLHWGNGSIMTGSEHTVDGKQYPMELHIVNMKSSYANISAALGDPTGLAVLAFFIEATSDRGKPESWKNLTSFLPNIPYKGNVTDIMSTITLDSLLEGVDRTKYFRYSGSLTTPFCNEAVIWTVFKDPIKVSQDLINLFSTTVYINETDSSLITNNFRGIQPLNGRVVSTQPSSSSPYYTLSTGVALLYCVVMFLINRQ